MNTDIYDALAQLEKAGATKVPKQATIEAARKGKTFSGKKLMVDFGFSQKTTKTVTTASAKNNQTNK